MIGTRITIFQYCCYCQVHFSKVKALNCAELHYLVQSFPRCTGRDCIWRIVHPIVSTLMCLPKWLSRELQEWLRDWKRKCKWLSYLPQKNSLCFEVFEWRTALKITKSSDYLISPGRCLHIHFSGMENTEFCNSKTGFQGGKGEQSWQYFPFE